MNHSTEYNRRQFLRCVSAGTLAVATLPLSNAWGAEPSPVVNAAPYRPLVLIELKGANDGLNTWVPFEDPLYHAARPTIALKKDAVLPISAQFGLHPELKHLRDVWAQGQLAVIQGVGYPQPVLSHFRSTDIWDTGSTSEQVLSTGWLTRALALNPLSTGKNADFVSIGSNEMGPGQGGAKTINLAAAQSFVNQARLAKSNAAALAGALAHIAKVDNDIVGVAANINAKIEFKTEFLGPMAGTVRAAATVLASRAAPVVRITLGGFDTHRGQLADHARLMQALSQGIQSLQAALTEQGLWQDTLVLTTSEFGRRVRENASGGTDHGTASTLFATGGRAKGGVFGAAPSLSDLDATSNLKHSVDFRSVYASALSQHWGMSPAVPLAVFAGAPSATLLPLGFIA